MTPRGAAWTAILDSNSEHFRNLAHNKSSMIVYKAANFELLAKGDADVAVTNEYNIASITIDLTWLQITGADATIITSTNAAEIANIVRMHLPQS